MSLRTALAGATTTTLLVAALGNSGVVDAARDADSRALALTVTGFANWDVANAPGDVVAGVLLRLGVVVVVVALLCALAGTARARGAAFIGGWGALVVAGAAAGAVEYVYRVAVVFDGQSFGNTYADGLVIAVNAGAAFGLWTGWLMGLAVALFTQPAGARQPVPAGAAPPWAAAAPAHRIAEPPPPWWAPTQAGSADATVRPGPTAFPPGGVVPPAAQAPIVPGPSTPPVAPGAPQSAVPAASATPEAPLTPEAPAPREAPTPPAPAPPAPSPGATHEMTTASGDPHPSDPDATQAVGLTPQDQAADADATTSMPESTDRTIPMPRKPD